MALFYAEKNTDEQFHDRYILCSEFELMAPGEWHLLQQYERVFKD